MAEKTIGIKIQLNGVDTVISDIKTFENEIKKAREDLKGIEIGSAQFKKLSSEIGLAESQMLGLIQSTKRLTKEREIEGIGKLGQGIASSFAAATAAVSLFGNESEEVQKAATAASNLLTLALSARGIAEVKLGAQLVLRTIAERAAAKANELSRAANLAEVASLDASTTAFAANTTAEAVNTTVTQANSTATAQGTIEANLNTGAQAANTVATGAAAGATTLLTRAQVALYTAIAANPILALVSALGLLVTLFVAFGKEQDKEIVKTKTLNELRNEGVAQTETEITKIQILTSIIKDNNSSLDARYGAYEQLKKLVPELSDLTLEEAESQGLLNVAIEREIQLIGLRAEQKAIENFLVQEAEKRIKAQDDARLKEIETLKEVTFWEGVRNGLLKVYYGIDVGNKNQKEIDRLEKGSVATKKDLANITKQIVTLEGQADKTKKNSKASTEKATQAEANRKKQLEGLVDALAKQVDLQSKLLFQTFSLEGPDATILANLEDRVGKSEALVEVIRKLKSVSELYNETQMELVGLEDEVGQAFLKATKAGEGLFDSLKKGDDRTAIQQNLTKSLEDYRKTIEEVRLESGKYFNQDQLNQLSNLELIYEDLTKSLQKFVQISPVFETKKWEKNLVDFALATGEILTDPYKRTEEEINKAKASALKSIQDSEKEFVKSFVAAEKAANAQRIKNIEAQKGGAEQLVELFKSFEESGQAAFQNLQKQGIEILKFEDGVRKTATQIDILNAKLRELAPEARKGFIIQNAEEIAKEYDSVFIPLVLRKEEELKTLQDKIRTRNFEEDVKYKDALVLLETELANQKIDISTLSYEERLILLEKFLKKEVEKTKEAEDEKAEARKKTLDTLQQAFDMFNDLIGETSSLIQQKIAMDLKMLERSFNESLTTVVGDTEEANQKRLELTKQYEIQKAQIEKEATIKSLQAQKLQAIASAASAIIAAQELLPPFNVIQTGIVAGVAAAQVALIQQQIEQARSMAGGGMIFGASHENGGVMVGGGYNLEGGESVINKVSTVQYGSLLSSINQMGGGRAITNSTQNGLMEERLMQAIAKTKNEPIRAYVLNSEITSGQAINRRLSELASL
jgi:hypothetical protein